MLEFLVVFSLILASGANPLIRTIYFFVACSCVYGVYCKKVNRKYFLISLILIGYIVLDSCVLNVAPTDYKECVLLTVRILCCVIVATNMRIYEFKKIFLRIMSFLSIMSLIFFAVYMIAGTLPGIQYQDGWIGAFYHTIGYGGIEEGVHRVRNCGIFAEPGVFQMYLNLALLMLCSSKDITLKKARKLFYLFSITLISTFSSMGYLLYACVIVVIYIENRQLLPMPQRLSRKKRVALIVFFAVCIAIAEVLLGYIGGFVTNTNSWASRHDDTVLTFLIAKDHPLFGLGLATDMEDVWITYYNRYESIRLYRAFQNARSCGLGNYMAQGGILFATVYMISIIVAYLKIFDFREKLANIITAFVFIMFVLEEPLLATPIYLITFFYCTKPALDWKMRKTVKEKRTQACAKTAIIN